MKLFYFYVLFQSQGNQNVQIVEGEADSTLENFNFYALPFGHVESDLYNELKFPTGNVLGVDGLVVEKEKMIIPKGFITFPIIPSNFDTGQKRLKDINFRKNTIIDQKPFQLVDLSHQFGSWSRNFQLAKMNNRRAQLILPEDIVSDFDIIRNYEDMNNAIKTN